MRQLISQKERGSSVKQDVQPSKNVNQQDVATQSNERENNDIKVKVKLQRRAINIFRVLTVIINQQEQKTATQKKSTNH